MVVTLAACIETVVSDISMSWYSSEYVGEGMEGQGGSVFQ